MSNTIQKTKKQVIDSIVNRFKSIDQAKENIFNILTDKIYSGKQMTAIKTDHLPGYEDDAIRKEILLQMMQENKPLWL